MSPRRLTLLSGALALTLAAPAQAVLLAHGGQLEVVQTGHRVEEGGSGRIHQVEDSAVGVLAQHCQGNIAGPSQVSQGSPLAVH